VFILVVQEKFKQGNKHRKSVGKQIGEKTKCNLENLLRKSTFSPFLQLL